MKVVEIIISTMMVPGSKTAAAVVQVTSLAMGVTGALTAPANLMHSSCPYVERVTHYVCVLVFVVCMCRGIAACPA
jgi:hypothetical protein